MDYTPDKNALLKAQWDLIHNPENVQFAWTEDMEEGAMMDFNMSAKSALEIVNNIRAANIKKVNRLNMLDYVVSRGYYINTFKIGSITFNNFNIQVFGSGKLLDSTLNETFDIKPSVISKTNESSLGETSGNFIKYTFHAFKETPDVPLSEQLSETSLLEITINETDSWAFEHYLFNLTPQISIKTTNIETDSLYTLSSFNIGNENITGYMIERPAGTLEEERTEGSLKRIPAGLYPICFPYGIYRPATTRTNKLNELWVKTYGKYDQQGGYITRDLVLIHIGNVVWDSEGCILPGTGHQKFTLYEDYKVDKTGEVYTKGTVLEKVTGSTDLLNNTLAPYLRGKINTLKSLGIDKSDSEYLKIEIELNR